MTTDDRRDPRPHGDAGPIDTVLPWIDWIRFLAAFEVFLFHLRLYVFEPYDRFAPAHKNVAVVLWFAITHFGGEAVLVFFALSGYLVGGGLIERVRMHTFKPGSYAIDRAVRLMLPFVPALAVAVGLQMLKHEPIDGVVVLANLLSLQGVLKPVQPYLGVDWSLAYEVWFYVLGGGLAACFTIPRRRGLAIAIVAIAFLIFSVLSASLLFCWVFGALFAQIPLRRGRWTALLGGLAMTCAGLLLGNDLFAPFRTGRLHMGPMHPALCQMLVTIGTLIVLRHLIAMPPRSSFARKVDRLGTRFAAFSYSLYLIHVPVLVCLGLFFPDQQDMTPRALLQYCGYVAVVPLVAYGFYWLFERNTDPMRRWLKSRLGIA